jgi:hypothetical protein
MDRYRDTLTDRLMNINTEIATDRQTNGREDIKTNIKTNIKTDGLRGCQIYYLTGIATAIQTDSAVR